MNGVLVVGELESHRARRSFSVENAVQLSEDGHVWSGVDGAMIAMISQHQAERADAAVVDVEKRLE